MASHSIGTSPNNWFPTPETHLAFDCPECDHSFEVDLGMFRSILDEGCIFCDATASADAFSSVSPTS